MAYYFIYNHGGSGNHGCEALVRTALDLFQNDEKIPVLSESPQQDSYYGIDAIAPVMHAVTGYSKLSYDFLAAYLALKVKGDYFEMDVLPYRKQIRNLEPGQVELSVGGDVYCYEDYRKYILLHKLVSARGCKSVLLGCSLEESLFSDPAFVEDMRRYDYISARESLTYEMLQHVGLKHIGLSPDSAFTLEPEEVSLPDKFLERDTIGINLSPLVVRKEAGAGIVMENFAHLIRYILDYTQCNVALIPHVVWESNDDRVPLRQLYEEFHSSGRVVLVEDHNCRELKFIISKCRFFIGARTHATIAAYSSCVPTLVLGYSVKSRGIARDLFGTEDGYVLPVQGLTKPGQLTDAFVELWEQQKTVRQHLINIMPGYIERAGNIKKLVEQALNL